MGEFTCVLVRSRLRLSPRQGQAPHIEAWPHVLRERAKLAGASLRHEWQAAREHDGQTLGGGLGCGIRP